MSVLAEKTIAVIDDDEMVRDSFTALLEARNFRVMGFESCGQFLDRPIGPKPRCLVLDVHMPEMGGLDLLQSMRDTGDVTPVVLVTGRNDPRITARAEALGAATLLEKPVNPTRLFQAIELALASG
jgi:FixJ family two-component response regulator